MRKSKQGPALFDLLKPSGAKQSDALKVPSWWERPEPARAPVLKPTPSETSADPPSAPPPRQGAVELEGERVRVSFTSWTAALTVFIAMVLVVGAFEMGRRSGVSSGYERGHAAGRDSYIATAVDEIEAARNQPPSTDLITSLLQPPTEQQELTKESEPVPERDASRKELNQEVRPAPSRAVVQPVLTGVAKRPKPPTQRKRAKTTSKWIRDYTYIVTQEFSVGRDEDARRAQDFLADRGVATELVRYPSGSIQLMTLQGYNRKDSTQRKMADRLLQKVHATGVDFFRQGGGYKLEGYFKKLTGDSW